MKAGLLLALASAAIATGTAGADPAAPSPDPARMVLVAKDFAAASISSQGYQDASPPIVSEYDREFERLVFHGTKIDFLSSDAAIASTPTAVKTEIAQIARSLGTKRGRQAFADFLAENSPAGTKVTVGKPRAIALGDSSVEFAVRLSSGRTSVAVALAYVQVDRVLETVGAGRSGRSPSVALVKSLARIVIGRAHAALLPLNTAPPTIFGRPMVGTTLTASAGTWSGGKPTFTFQWLRCNPAGAACAPIAGATAATYVPVAADAGSTLRAAVTAHVAGGTVTAQSNQTALVGALAPPANTAPPVIAGTPAQGQTLTASPGTWAGSPSFAFQWQRCDAAGANCADVAGATAQTYALTAADVGFTLRVVVTATNSSGPVAASSPQTALVA